MLQLPRAIVGILSDALNPGVLFLRSSSAVRAENLVLRRQLARYIERGIKPRRVDHVTRVSLALFTRLFDWRSAVVNVLPSTIVRWHRPGYVLVLIEHGSRRLLHCNVTAHPSAAWTLQQLREAIDGEAGHRYLLHDGDSTFASGLDQSIKHLGLRVLKSPPHSPKANAICERVIGTIRRECLDWLIPLSESHLRTLLKSWVGHYNRGRPYMALGPGVPDPRAGAVRWADDKSRYCLGAHAAVCARSLPGGLHHEYSFAPALA